MSEEPRHEHQETHGEAAVGVPGVILTPKALEMVKAMHAKEGLGAEQGLRVAVVGGGCSGFQYSLSFDARKEGDTVEEFDGLKVFIDEVSLPYIAGTTLDYVEGLHAAGFRFDNPRASRTCGCGSSFSA
ncbi:MAG TPA: iron-sulfur cluster assembly accessory protein [Candidatus Binataceae bacterium]|jgi:iron-sulfur cluster assembly accessory protein|nr:iron-sulfur cluster assembly accessory protein [Candidatus Binataceae bacterium]